MAKTYSAEEVARHNTADSCWVILYGNVYDVTEFVPEHPGGAKIILQLGGRDATAEFDPVHPAGTLEEHLKSEAKLGSVDAQSLAAATAAAQRASAGAEEAAPALALERLLNLDEIEAAAKRRVSRKAWAYYYSAADDLVSKRLNGAAFAQVLLRPRVMVDCTRCDTATTLLGMAVGTPLYVAPTAMARLAHPAGEAGIAAAVARFGAVQVVSNNASMTPEQVVAGARAGAQAFGWQLYVQTDRRRSEAMLARVNRLRAFYRFVVLTLDAPVPGKREDDERAQAGSTAAVTAATQADDAAPGAVRPTAGGGIGQQMFAGTAADLTWEPTLAWLARHTDLPIVLKGIQTHEDARRAARYAADHPGTVAAIVLSNHGGRALDTAPPAVHTLLEIRKYAPEVFDRLEVWIDGGVRRGTDIVKALCLGAKAVGIGRAALWGLGAGGPAGVERTFEILMSEMATCMRLLGATKISDLGPQHINTRMVERDIYDGGDEPARLWVGKPKI